MKLKTTLLTGILCWSLTAHSQDAPGVEKSLFTVQTGLIGAWVNHEARLGTKFALRTEAGLDAVASINTDDTKFGLAPSVNIEPRWYYNIIKRDGKGKFTGRNSASFVTVSFKYLPDSFIITNYDNINVPDQIYIVPKWGIRRSIAKSKFNYEAGIGLGYYTILEKQGIKNEEGTALDLHLRIGYTF